MTVSAAGYDLTPLMPSQIDEMAADLSEEEAAELTDRIESEVNEIFYGRNFANDANDSE